MKKQEKYEKVEGWVLFIFGVWVLIVSLSIGWLFWRPIAKVVKHKAIEGMVRYNDDNEQFEYKSSNHQFAWFDGGWPCADSKIKEIAKTESLQEQIDCLASGGHKWVYVKQRDYSVYLEEYFLYVFRCSKCQKQVEKLYEQLSDAEKEALTELGVTNE